MDMARDYAAGWSRRLDVAKESRNKRVREAAAAAQRCAQLLYDNYGVSKVYLFGSLSKPETFHDGSDIDLAVAGLPPRLYFKALADLWRQLPPSMKLDLVPFEDADPELRKRLLKEAVTLSG